MFEIRIEGKQPIYEQICDQISGLISSGAVEAGERLPTVRETAKSLGINPNTVQKAYNLLEQKGFIYSVPAKGSYVSDNSSASAAMVKMAADALKTAMVSARKAGMAKNDVLELVEALWQ